VDRLRRELAEEEGREPVLVGASWPLPGELGLYCEGQPQVYSLGRALGDRHSQYDLWPGPLTNPEAFLGRTFLVVNMMEPQRLAPAFEQIGPTRRVEARAGDQPLAIWTLTVCRGFRGVPPELLADDKH
jgi:hypothetical protein